VCLKDIKQLELICVMAGAQPTVKPFNLAVLKVGDFACKIILALYFGELKPYNSKYCSNFVLFWPAVDIRAL